MDTLFRLANNLQYSDQQQSFNSSTRTTTTSSSSRSFFSPPQQLDQEECYTFFMDEEDFSSSSSKHNSNNYYDPYHQQQQLQHHQHLSQSTTPTPTTTNTSTPPQYHHHQQQQLSSSSAFHEASSADHFSNYSAPHDLTQEFTSLTSGKWASDILMEAARAMAENNTTRLQQLVWMLNELSSPYGDVDQKLASYFLQALFSRMTGSGQRSYRSLAIASEKTSSFESTRKTVLKFQEVSPWTTFGHVASNGAIMEALEGENKLHIIDFGTTFCTQWPTFLEALATRSDETPELRLTTVVASRAGGQQATMAVQKVMREIGNRMEKFARLMGVPFKFKFVLHIGELSELNIGELEINEEEALAINCIGSLHSVQSIGNRRDHLISMFRRLQPRIVTLVEEEADLDHSFDFLRGFEECLRWFKIYLEALEDCFPKTSNERLVLERAAGRAVVDLLACDPSESVERRETAVRWSHRLHAAGFRAVPFSDEVSDDVRALLRRYKEGWTMAPCSDAGIFLMRKDQPVVWASAWRP